jgi:hypothetical protein
VPPLAGNGSTIARRRRFGLRDRVALKELRAAIVDGELDKVLMAAKKDRAQSWKRAKK